MDILAITSRYDNTHMPFIVNNNKGDELFLFTIRINGIWKIHYCLNNSEVIRLNTGVADEVNECSPTALFQNDKWYVSFVAGGHVTSKRLKLYTMALDDTTPTIIGISKTGFTFGDNATCAVGTHSSFSYPGRHVATQYNIKKSIEMLCVRPLGNDLSNLHISYNTSGNNIITVIYNVATKVTNKITTSEGLPLYKGCFYKGTHYFAKKIGDAFEDRVITSTSNVITEPVNDEYAVRISDYMGRSLLDVNLTTTDMLNLLPEDLR